MLLLHEQIAPATVPRVPRVQARDVGVAHLKLRRPRADTAVEPVRQDPGGQTVLLSLCAVREETASAREPV